MNSPKQIADWLAAFIRPGQITELRAFGLKAHSVRAGYFDADHLTEMARAAAELSPGSRGVYFIPNPIRPALLARAENVVRIGVPATVTPNGQQTHTTTDAEIDRRHWLLIDTDPIRAKGAEKESATDDERQAAWTLCQNVRTALSAAGCLDPLIASSGNGWHLCYPIDLPNSETAGENVQRILAGLGERYNTPEAKVDRVTFNAARIWKVYGTVARKGAGTDDRPHRPAFIHQLPSAHSAAANTTALLALLRTWKSQTDLFDKFTKQAGGSDKVVRARAYLAKCPPAVSGSGGHNATWNVVATVVQGFELSEAEALDALHTWNASCQPPWSKAELLHKIRDAIRLAGETGKLLNADRPKTKPAEVVIELDDTDAEDATVADLDEAGIKWLWPGWVQVGALVTVAGGEGCGKTRLCADLARRLWHGLEWPDGTPNDNPPGSRVMWIPADGQWAELPGLCDLMGIPREAVVLNARRGNLYTGTDLDEDAALITLERRIKRLKPALVFVDTVTNATSREVTKTSEAKQFFKPLYEIAARCETTVVAVSHVNTGGRSLGVRVEGASRQVLTIEWEGDDRAGDTRKLSVTKSNSKKPPPLRVLAGGDRYEYQPFGDGEDKPKPKKPLSKKQVDAAKWIRKVLAAGEKQFGPTVAEWELQGGEKDDVFFAVRLLEQIGTLDVVERGPVKWLVPSAGGV